MKKLFLATVVGLLILTAIAFLISLFLPPQFDRLLWAWVALIIAAVCLIVMIVDIIFLLPTVHGAIYFPSSDAQIATILKLAQVVPGEKAVDIGSGDGRIVTALAAAGAEAHGYEINPFLVVWSRLKTRTLSKKNRGHHHLANLWFTNFSEFQVVTLFGMTYIMKDLEKKLMTELKPGARVICNSFPFPNWQPERKIGNIYLYLKK